MRTSKSKQVRSLVHIVRLLDTEGIDAFALNRIQSFFRQQWSQAARQKEEFERTRDEFIEIMRERNPRERKVIGHFLNMKNAQSFQVGLKIGLTVALNKAALEVDDGEA